MDRWKFVNEKWIPRPVSRGKGCDTEIPLSHPTSAPSGHLLPMEGGSVHASPFPWKGLPSAAWRGWLPFCGARVLSLMVYLRRSLPALFHTARTLSGSLRSPPSPRGEGFVSGIPLPPIQLPPLRGTSFHRKEGASTRAPSYGRGYRAQRGGVGFLFAAKRCSRKRRT